MKFMEPRICMNTGLRRKKIIVIAVYLQNEEGEITNMLAPLGNYHAIIEVK